MTLDILMNPATCQWSRVTTTGTSLLGRYGHSLTLVESRLFLFGGEVDDEVFNDLLSFDLNSLQQPEFQWELIHSGGKHLKDESIPCRRTNHSMVSFNKHLFL